MVFREPLLCIELMQKVPGIKCGLQDLQCAEGREVLTYTGLTAELARIAVRVKLLDIATAMTSTEFWRNPQKHGLQEDGSLYFIVGLGQHSKTGESILGPSVLQMLEQEFGLHAHYHPKNEALLRIPKHQLVRFVEDRSGLLEKKKPNA